MKHKTTTRHPLWARISVALLLVAMFIVPLGTMVAHADPDKEDKWGFYTISSNVTSFFSNSVAPKESGSDAPTIPDRWEPIASSPANAGSFVGYGDNDVSGVSGWFVSSLTGSSNTIGYAAFEVRSDDDEVQRSYEGILEYLHFGSTLTAAGYDQVGSAFDTMIFRVLGGVLIWIAYILASSVDIAFNLAIWLLNVLNPFRIIYDPIQRVSGDALANAMTNGEKAPTLFSGLSAFLGDIYSALISISWSVTIPLLLVGFVVSLFFLKESNHMGKLKKILIRMAFLVIGIPLLGMTYSAALTSLDGAGDIGQMGATKVVLSNYLDFESWAVNYGLGIPEDAVIEWSNGEHGPSAETFNKARMNVLLINSRSYSINVPNHYAPNTVNLDETDSGLITDAINGTTINGNILLDTSAMLGRYIGGSKISASNLETAFKGSLNNYIKAGKLSNTQVTHMFDVKKSGESNLEPKDNPLLSVKEGTGLQVEKRKNGVIEKFKTGANSYCGGYVSDAEGNTWSCNLSPLARFNYLNTEFNADSATTYSAVRAASGATRMFHYSVNQVGTGVMGMVYWFNSLVILASFVIIGYAYALSLIIAAFKNTFKLVSAIPFAALGAIAAMAKLVVYTFTLICETLGVVFLFRLVQDMLLAIPQIVAMPIQALQNSLPSLAIYFSSGLIVVLSTAFSTVMIIAFTIMCLRLRSGLMKGATEAATKLVNKFFEVDGAPSMPKGPGLGSRIGAAAASGAGMAAANRALTGSDGKGGLIGAAKNHFAGDNVQKAGGVGGTGGALPPGKDPDGSGDGPGPDDKPTPGGGSGMQLDASDAIANHSETDAAITSNLEAQGGLPDRSAQFDEHGKPLPANTSGGDTMSTVADGMADSQAKQKAAGAKKLEAAKETVKATYHGAKGAAHAYAGDAKGAAVEGVQAAQSLKAAGDNAKAARDIKKSADKPRVEPGKPQSAQRSATPTVPRSATPKAATPKSATPKVSGAKAQAPQRGATPAPKAPAAPKTPGAPAAPKVTPRAPQGGARGGLQRAVPQRMTPKAGGTQIVSPKVSAKVGAPQVSQFVKGGSSTTVTKAASAATSKRASAAVSKAMPSTVAKAASVAGKAQAVKKGSAPKAPKPAPRPSRGRRGDKA